MKEGKINSLKKKGNEIFTSYTIIVITGSFLYSSWYYHFFLLSSFLIQRIRYRETDRKTLFEREKIRIQDLELVSIKSTVCMMRKDPMKKEKRRK